MNDSSTISIFQLFHAPLGFTIIGFGALNNLLAAPLDNYWHELYGIDVTLWSPFHIMGTIGGILMGLGSIYVFASEAVLVRQHKSSRHFLSSSGPEWGLLLLLAAFMEIALPALTAFNPLVLGSWVLLTYPLPLAGVCGFCLVGAIQATRKPGTAILTTLLLWLISIATQVFVPVALHYTVARLGLSYRFPGRTPIFNFVLALLPLFFLFSTFMIDSIAFWQYKQHGKQTKHPFLYALLYGGVIAITVTVVPAGLVRLLQLFPSIKLNVDVVHVLTPDWRDMLLAFPAAFCTATMTAILGTIFGDVWHWSGR